LEAFEGPIVSHQIPPPSLLSLFSLCPLLSLALSGFASTDFAIEGSTRLTSKQATDSSLTTRTSKLATFSSSTDFYFYFCFGVFVLTNSYKQASHQFDDRFFVVVAVPQLTAVSLCVLGDGFVVLRELALLLFKHLYGLGWP
jgi:hypothetical protein